MQLNAKNASSGLINTSHQKQKLRRFCCISLAILLMHIHSVHMSRKWFRRPARFPHHNQFLNIMNKNCNYNVKNLIVTQKACGHLELESKQGD